MTTTKCEPHDWSKQDDYSQPGSIHRFRCSKCGAWGYMQLGFKKPKVRAYAAAGRSLFEPKLEWKRDWENEDVNENPLDVVGGNNPDRTSPDDDASDYRPPRRWRQWR